MKVSSLVLALVATAASAAAQTVTPISAPFAGDRQEDFELPNSTPLPPCVDNGVFETPGAANHAASLCSSAGAASVTTSWVFSCTTGPHGGSRFCGSTAGDLRLDFGLGGRDVFRFGGYFGSNAPGVGGISTNIMIVKFLDASGAQIGFEQYGYFSGCGQWDWFGWEITGAAARAIEITGFYGDGAFIDVDDLEVTFVTGPAPTVYCTSSATSSGCFATIAANGDPNVAHSNSCVVLASNVEGQRTGIIFYGLARNASPWCGGGVATFLCVKPPTQRSVPQFSGGTNGACDGSLTLNWNAFQLAHPGALGQPWSAGATADLQAWFRDPPSCKATSLSNAVELTYQP
jgi:hypothetical protein